MNVSAIIVTRGDVDVVPILESFPDDWEFLIWDNGKKALLTSGKGTFTAKDLSVYGRYAAIEYASGDLIYVQDDDCVVSDPQALVETYLNQSMLYTPPKAPTQYAPEVVCNMPPEFRHDFYSDHALVGFGAVFHRDAPARAFKRFAQSYEHWNHWTTWKYADPITDAEWENERPGFFPRTCDIVFTALTPRVLVDVPKTNLWWAEDETRMYRQPQHVEERARMLELVKQVRDA